MTHADHYDWIIVGSGFGGSVAAHRLTEKGYRVLVLEKGRRWSGSDFPDNAWDLRKWQWKPAARLFGFFQMTFFRHVTVLSGVGVGGGSLVYANTHAQPERPFFEQGSWAGLRDWQAELAPHYDTARRMLGSTPTPSLEVADEALRELAVELGREEHFRATDVGVYFGEPGVSAPDPYFDGAGPERTGCIKCGGCMLGCQHNAKNSLDKNYLWLAERGGCTVLPETEVTALRRQGAGFAVDTQQSTSRLRRQPHTYTADRVVVSGGVLGSNALLLREKRRHLPQLSDQLGQMVRTNSESLIAVVTEDEELDLSHGVAIGSILHTDDRSHVEPVRYPQGGVEFYRMMIAPHVPGDTLFKRIAGLARVAMTKPRRLWRTARIKDLGRSSSILLYMRTDDGTLSFREAWNGLQTALTPGSKPPAAFIPEATEIAERMADKLKGLPWTLGAELVLGTPTTAHILGGCCIGETAVEGVIDADHQVHGVPGLYVIDGSTISANPGVNPSLTITAMAERAMANIAPKQ